MFSSQLPLSAAKENLRRLLIVRLIASVAQLAGLYFARFHMQAALNYPALLGVIGLMLLISALTFFRLGARRPVTDAEYFSQLLIDVTGLTVLLYFAGGSTNPFISYYLVILTISAATLPRSYTLAMALIACLAYTVLIFLYRPLNSEMGGMHGADHFFNLHIVGMWLTFVVSAALITFFVVRMAQTLREQDAVLADSREKALHDEQLLAVATLAAGAAHELGTPLSTMSVLLDEMRKDNRADEQLSKDLDLLTGQVANCRASIRKLADKTEPAVLAGEQSVSVAEFISDILEQWRIMRPDVKSRFQQTGQGEIPSIQVDDTMRQAVLNLLNNAGDASPEHVDIELGWDGQAMLLSIRDYGPGIPMEMADKIGKPFVSTKRKGLGLGLFLSHATVARFSGQVALFNHEEGGTLTELKLPVQ